jgi:uncharacterized protein with GYD domain
MPTFIFVGNFTDQGIRSIKDSVKRSEAVKELAKKFGVTMTDFKWTMGAYDMVVQLEAPDGPSMSAFALAVGMAGNVRGQTLRSYSKAEMEGILKKIG